MPKYTMLIMENEAPYADQADDSTMFRDIMEMHQQFSMAVTDSGATILFETAYPRKSPQSQPKHRRSAEACLQYITYTRSRRSQIALPCVIKERIPARIVSAAIGEMSCSALPPPSACLPPPAC